MQKSTEEAPTPSVTRSDIFGADDTCDKDDKMQIACLN
jgi:hypothetical protein